MKWRAYYSPATAIIIIFLIVRSFDLLIVVGLEREFQQIKHFYLLPTPALIWAYLLNRSTAVSHISAS